MSRLGRRAFLASTAVASPVLPGSGTAAGASAKTSAGASDGYPSHGGGIEAGTSELCLDIAGYHPAGLTPAPAEGPLHDYWMFEGLRPADHGDLHVTSAHSTPSAMTPSVASGRAVP